MAAREEIIRRVMGEAVEFSVDVNGVSIPRLNDVAQLRRLLTIAENQGGEATFQGSLRIAFPVTPIAPG